MGESASGNDKAIIIATYWHIAEEAMLHMRTSVHAPASAEMSRLRVQLVGAQDMLGMLGPPDFDQALALRIVLQWEAKGLEPYNRINNYISKICALRKSQLIPGLPVMDPECWNAFFQIMSNYRVEHYTQLLAMSHPQVPPSAWKEFAEKVFQVPEVDTVIF